MGFLRIVFSVCRGVSDFPALLDKSPARAFFHLFLFCLLLALASAAIKGAGVFPTVRTAADALDSYFGELTLRGESAVPQKNADKPKTFILTKSLRLDYIPATAASYLDSINDWKQPTGIVWAPKGLFIWMRAAENGEDKYVYLSVPLGTTLRTFVRPSDTVSYAPVSAAKFKKYVLENAMIPDKDVKTPPHTTSFQVLTAMVPFVFAIFIFLSVFFGNFMLAAATTFLFALVQSMWKQPGLEKLNFKNTFVMMVYASFPAVAVSTFFFLVPIPFLNYQTAFFIVFFIYQILVFNFLRKTFNPKREPPANNDDQDFY